MEIRAGDGLGVAPQGAFEARAPARAPLLVRDQPCAQIFETPDRGGLGTIVLELAAFEAVSVALVK